MLARPAISGWGLIAFAFWPAALIVLLLNPKGRGIAVWAVGTYLVIAFIPVSFRNGPQPFPAFDGRNVLFASLPFALCLAWTIHLVAERVFRRPWTQRGWAVAFVAIVAIGYTDRHAIKGFRDRPTGRVGQAIQHALAQVDRQSTSHIVMPASLYIRYHILFPEDLKSRVRVAVDDHSPPWWRHASVDILSRVGPLPGPEDAYLLATPRQLMGKSESWDYGVRLPNDRLAQWQRASPVVTISRFQDNTIGPGRSESEEGEPILLLLGPPPGATSVAGHHLAASRRAP